ncbi:MAG TPA: SGNH/GDSL hydrolase family protein [Pyrinomonadaceae bacterium]|jgi:lysophospholipase L1-like esterase|nr:SGNH/GDSL hydrolase family protein [Pyrinomonadaceae bacterium]
MKVISHNLVRKFTVISVSVSFIFSLFVSSAKAVVPSNGITPANQRTAQAVRGLENAGALSSFYEALADLKAGRRREPIRIAHYGDSHTAANILTAEVRRSFEREFGLYGESATQARSSIIYDVLGINGARAVRLLSYNESSFSSSVARRKPDLIILAYGTNEVTDNNWSVESYQRLFVSILRRFRRAAPQASILIFGPPDRAVRTGSGWQSVGRMTALLEAQRRAAIEMGAGFWSSYGAMGGAGSMNLWVAKGLGQRDHVHLTAPGYIKLGRLFYDDLLSGYEAHAPADRQRQQQNDLRRALQF